MSTLYNRLRTGTVPRLLAKYKTGVVEIGLPVTVDGINPWDAPTTTTQWTPLDAVVTGVSQKYVDGESIVSSDRMIITQTPTTYNEAAGDKVRIDGQVVAVLAVMPILAAGEPVALRLVVRG